MRVSHFSISAFVCAHRHYMAPEMLGGRYDAKADVFSLGVMMCELFSYFVDFGTYKAAERMPVPERPPARDDMIDQGLARLGGIPDLQASVKKMVKTKPGKRPTVLEVLSTLRQV